MLWYMAVYGQKSAIPPYTDLKHGTGFQGKIRNHGLNWFILLYRSIYRYELVQTVFRYFPLESRTVF
jgi:hypothetical protein